MNRMIDFSEVSCGEYIALFAMRTPNGLCCYVQRGELADLLVSEGLGIEFEPGLSTRRIRAWYDSLIIMLGGELEEAA